MLKVIILLAYKNWLKYYLQWFPYLEQILEVRILFAMAQQDVRIRLHDGLQAGSVQITISNPGRWPEFAAESHGGLGLVAALMPRNGAQLARAQMGEWAVLHLELCSPVIHLESSDASRHA